MTTRTDDEIYEEMMAALATPCEHCGQLTHVRWAKYGELKMAMKDAAGRLARDAATEAGG